MVFPRHLPVFSSLCSGSISSFTFIVKSGKEKSGLFPFGITVCVGPLCANDFVKLFNVRKLLNVCGRFRTALSTFCVGVVVEVVGIDGCGSIGELDLFSKGECDCWAWVGA